MRLPRPAAVVLRFVARYGLFLLLAYAVIEVVLVAVLFGERPRPVSPPRGYRSQVVDVDLQWTRGDHEGPLLLQIARTRDFSRPVHERRTTGSRHTAPPLPRGHRYYWRLEQDGGAVVGSFVVAPNAVRF